MKKKHQNEHSNLQTSTGVEADYYHSQWVGAIFFYVINLGKKPFSHFESKSYNRRNLIVGYFIKLLIGAILIFLAWQYL